MTLERTRLERAAILASLSASLREAEGRAPDSADDSVTTDAGDLIAGVRDYIEGTQSAIVGVALAEVAYAFVAGYRYGAPDFGAPKSVRKATVALRKAGLSL